MPSPHSSRQMFYSVDAAWLHMDSPTNSVAITSLFIYDRPIDFARLRATLQTRMLTFPRFTQVAREPRLPFILPTWEKDPCFDLDAHLHWIALPEPGDWPTLLELVEDLMRIPLHPSRPLWQMYYIDHYGQGSALVSRFSHALYDGYALMRVMKAITDESLDAPPPQPEPEPECEKPNRIVETARQTLNTVDGAVRMSRSLVGKGLGLVVHPRRLIGVAERSVSGALALGKLLFILPDHQTSLRGKCRVAKRAVASDPLPLAEVKSIGKTLGGTLNDVILGAMAGGIRRYLEEKGEPVESVSIRAMVPVYLKNGEQSNSGNGFGLTYLTLPVSIEDPLERLKAVHANMGAIKSTPEALVAYGILYGLGPFPPTLTRTISAIFGLKGTAVMTNVPGPQEKLYFAGAAVERVMFWVPQPAGLAVGLSIMSYAGSVTVCLATDAALIPHPEHIMAGFQAEYKELLTLVEQVREEA